MPKSSVGESFIVALISGTEKVWRRGGEYQGFPSKTFCLTVATKISLSYSFIVALISDIEKSLDKSGGGGYQKFTSKLFCLTVPKISVGEYFMVDYFRDPKMFGEGGRGSVKKFRQKFFVSQCRRKFP